MTRARLGDRMPLAASATASADSEAGLQGPTVSAAGEACVPAASAAAGSVAAVSAVGDSTPGDSGAKHTGSANSEGRVMSHLPSSYKVVTFAVILSLASCGKAVKPTAEAPVKSAEKTVPRTFALP